METTDNILVGIASEEVKLWKTKLYRFQGLAQQLLQEFSFFVASGEGYPHKALAVIERLSKLYSEIDASEPQDEITREVRKMCGHGE